LRCNVRGTEIRWTKNGEPIRKRAIAFGPSLTLMNLQAEDAGRYMCESEDGFDYIDLTVEGKIPY